MGHSCAPIEGPGEIYILHAKSLPTSGRNLGSVVEGRRDSSVCLNTVRGHKEEINTGSHRIFESRPVSVGKLRADRKRKESKRR